MTKKLFCLVIVMVVTGTIFVSAYSALAQGRMRGKDRVLSKVTFIHFRKGHAKPPWAGNDKNDKGDQGDYTYIAKGAKWKNIENLLVNTSCNENLDGLILDALITSLDEWETAGNKALEIFGDVIIDENVSYDDGAYRGSNTLSFGSYSNPDVIGVTTVWGYFTGPPSQREIVEAHILMNDDFEWGDASVDSDGDGYIDSHLMDVQNILTHELGHWAGMGDLYELAAGEETMYGYSALGETKKRDLYNGDITGISSLYK
ncbi:MAG: zinc metalloprotease [Planctomycetota bacterium]|jgi:hypothetical protein